MSEKKRQGAVKRAAILFANFGPYHVARINALASSLAEREIDLVAFRFSEKSGTYGWKPEEPKEIEVVTLGAAPPQGVTGAWRVARRFYGDLRSRKIQAVFLPTYSPLPNLLCFLAAKLAGCRTVLMTESWRGTERASFLGKMLKRVLIRMFDSALVGGSPQRDYVASYGMPREKIFLGYDVVDGAFFAKHADEIRSAQRRCNEWLVTGDEREGGVSEAGVSEGGGDSAISAFDLAFRRARFAAVAALQSVFLRSAQRFSVSDFRAKLGLPERYFLSLGRFVEKKNLATLVEAYARFASGQSSVDSRQGETRDQLLATRYPIPALVFVGSGEEEAALREQARELGLRVVERTGCAVTGNGSLVTGGEKIGVSEGGVSEAGVSVGGVSGGGVSGGGVSEAGGEKTKEEGRRKSVEGGSGAESRDQLPVTRHEENCGAVFFYPFQQVGMTPFFYALAEAFVLPSKYEEWGLVVNEAMACGVPVIVSDQVGASFDLVEDGKNGFVFDPEDVATLATALGRIANDAELRRRMGEAGERMIAAWSPRRFGEEGYKALMAI